VAIGSFAGYPTVANNAIVINGDTVALDAPNSGLYISPIRNNNSSNIVFYNTTTKEITYSTSYGNANVAAYLPTYTGNVTANYFIGNGSQLTGISAGNIVGGYGNADVANYLPTYTGNLTSLNTICATGNITGSYILGNGAFLTGVSGTGTYGNSNVSAYLQVLTSNISTTGNVIANNFVGGGNSTPAVSSTTNLDLSSPLSVRVLGGGTLRLPSLTTANIANLTPVNGDIIYNSSINKFQGYENGAWGNLI
jgi:hypothetical protein